MHNVEKIIFIRNRQLSATVYLLALITSVGIFKYLLVSRYNAILLEREYGLFPKDCCIYKKYSRNTT